jgi:DNA polymerase-1
MGDQLPRKDTLDRLRTPIADPGIAKLAHNGKYDMIVLSRHGVELSGLSFDTMIAAHLLGEKALGLKALAFNRLGVEMTPIASLIGTGAKQTSMDYVPIPEAAQYACADADMTYRLAALFEGELKEQELWSLFHDVEMQLVPVLFDMELTGVALDIDSLWAMSCNLGERMSELEADIYDGVGHQFNINSSQQLSTVLFEELRLPSGRKTKSGYSTDAAALEALKGLHPIIEPLLEYRQLTKLKSTYLDSLPTLVNPETGRIHTTFNQTGTATGRLSSSDPNLQNIPIRGELGREIRKAFTASDGCILLSADYSQIDLRVTAHLSQDPQLLAAFKRDDDIHRATAAEIFSVPPAEVAPGQRRLAKVVNFGVLYGMSGYGLEQATELTREEANQFIKTYYEKYSGVQKYVEETKRQASNRGYVETILGRRRYVPDINASNAQVRAAAERIAISTPIQGTAADIIKLAMINIHAVIKSRGMKSKMILQVHDELLFEVPANEIESLTRLVLDIMPNAMDFSVPLTVELKTGTNWGEMSTVKK